MSHPQQFDLPRTITLTVVLCAVAAGIAAFASNLYFNKQYELEQMNVRSRLTTPIDQVRYLTDKVGKLMKLPEGETPLIGSITNLTLLKDQPFFVKAKVGSQVLMYKNAGKAILYDPDEDKILEIGPYNPSATASGQTPSATASGQAPATLSK
jgi:hypothetical protein